MLSSYKGIFEDGKVIFIETPPVKTRTEVIVTFLERQSSDTGPRVLGGLKGKFPTPDDFNDPIDDLKEYM